MGARTVPPPPHFVPTYARVLFPFGELEDENPIASGFLRSLLSLPSSVRLRYSIRKNSFRNSTGLKLIYGTVGWTGGSISPTSFPSDSIPSVRTNEPQFSSSSSSSLLMSRRRRRRRPGRPAPTDRLPRHNSLLAAAAPGRRLAVRWWYVLACNRLSLPLLRLSHTLPLRLRRNRSFSQRLRLTSFVN